VCSRERRVNSGGGKLSRCGERLPKKVEQDGGMKKRGEDNLHEEGMSEKKKGNVDDRCAMASEEFDLIVIGPVKA